jgi:hypothetical protein
MKKIVWIVFLVALVVVNGAAMAAEYFGGVHIALPYRLTVVLGITMVSVVFAGAWELLKTAEQEEPRS